MLGWVGCPHYRRYVLRNQLRTHLRKSLRTTVRTWQLTARGEIVFEKLGVAALSQLAA